MTGLPFIRPPAPVAYRECGTASTGVLRLAVYGGLTVGESATIDELEADENTAFVAAARASDAIAQAEGISLTEALNVIEDTIVGNDLAGPAAEIAARHADQIQEIARLYAHSNRSHQLATVTALIRSRCELPEWTVRDSEKLLTPLFVDLWRLAQDEIAAEGNAEAPPVTEEELGKPPQESTERPKRTGRKSSTN